MKTVDNAKIAELLKEAAASPRRRTHFNLHESTDDPTNRLLVVCQPDTVIAPHRHMTKWELFTILEGKIAAYTYDDGGNVQEKVILGEDAKIVEIPAAVWHNFVALTPACAMEVKYGPYAPLTAEERAPFSGVLPE